MADVAKNLAKVIIGIILIVVAVWIAVTYASWGAATIKLIQGGIIILIIVIGIVLLMLGFTDMKS